MKPITSFIFFLFGLKKRTEYNKTENEFCVNAEWWRVLKKSEETICLGWEQGVCLWWVFACVGVGRPMARLELFVIRGPRRAELLA